MTPAQQALQEANKAATRERQDLYRRLFSGDVGLRVLRDLSVVFDMNAPAFQPGSDSHAAAQRDGQRMVINHILKHSTKPNQDANSQEG